MHLVNCDRVDYKLSRSTNLKRSVRGREMKKNELVLRVLQIEYTISLNIVGLLE